LGASQIPAAGSIAIVYRDGYCHLHRTATKANEQKRDSPATEIPPHLLLGISLDSTVKFLAATGFLVLKDRPDGEVPSEIFEYNSSYTRRASKKLRPRPASQRICLFRKLRHKNCF
jgi:hypothetical protein